MSGAGREEREGSRLNSTAAEDRKQSKRRVRWSKTRRRRFLEELALTCDVRRSAAIVEQTDSSARRLRAREPAFAQQWEQAFDAGRQRLEEELVARSLRQVPAAGGPGKAGMEMPADEDADGFDTALALKLLALRRARTRQDRATCSPAATQEELDAALFQRLVALGERLAGSRDAAEREAADNRRIVEAAASGGGRS